MADTSYKFSFPKLNLNSFSFEIKNSKNFIINSSLDTSPKRYCFNVALGNLSRKTSKYMYPWRIVFPTTCKPSLSSSWLGCHVIERSRDSSFRWMYYCNSNWIFRWCWFWHSSFSTIISQVQFFSFFGPKDVLFLILSFVS